MYNYRIMILDDEKAITELLRRNLTLAGYTDIETYTDTRTAIERFKSKKFHIVLTDIVMPDMDGIEVLRKIKEYDSFTQVIMMTGFSTIDTTLACLEAGANDYILKPFKSNNYILEVVEYSSKKLERWKEAIKGIIE